MSPGGHLGDPERPRSPTRPSRGPHGGPHRALGAPPDRRGEGHTWPHGALSPGVRRSDPVPQMQLSETLPPPGLRRGSAWEGSSEPGGQEGRPPYLWRLWPARLPPWGSGATPPTSGTHHLPLEGRRERGWGAGAGGCAAPSPGHPSPRAPCGRGPSARQGGLRAAGLPAEPQRLRGKDFRDGCLSTTPPFWGESLRDAYWEPPGRPGRKGYGHQPRPGGCLAHGARAGPTAGAGAPGTQSWSRRMGRTKSPR